MSDDPAVHACPNKPAPWVGLLDLLCQVTERLSALGRDRLNREGIRSAHFRDPSVLLLAVLLCCGTLGCKKSRKATRLQYTRQQVAANMKPERGPIHAIATPKVLQALKDATPASLKNPTPVAAVAYARGSRREVVVWWLEDFPTIDGFVLRRGRNGQTIRLQIPQAFVRFNKKEAESIVLFNANVVLGENDAAAVWSARDEWELALAGAGRVSNFVGLDVTE